jgi:hypothetical protein
MLYDPKWEKQAPVKPDPVYDGVRLSEFIAWLETMPANERYDYSRPEQCALAQFLASRGAPADDQLVALPIEENHWLDTIAHSRTFGQALAKAKKYQTSL